MSIVPLQNNEANDCPICLDPITPEDTIAAHPAGLVNHIFHRSCVIKDISMRSTQCALCRDYNWQDHTDPEIQEAIRSRNQAHQRNRRYLDVMREVISQGNLEVVRQELLNRRDDFLNISSNLLLTAVKSNHVEIVEELMRNMDPISDMVLGVVLIQGSSRESLNSIRAIVFNERLSQRLKEVCLQVMAYCNYLDIVEELLERTPISDEARGRAVLNAVSSRRDTAQMVGTLLRNGSIPLSYRLKAINECLKTAKFGILRELIPVGPILASIALTGVVTYLNTTSKQEEQ